MPRMVAKRWMTLLLPLLLAGCYAPDEEFGMCTKMGFGCDDVPYETNDCGIYRTCNDDDGATPAATSPTRYRPFGEGVE